MSSALLSLPAVNLDPDMPELPSAEMPMESVFSAPVSGKVSSLYGWRGERLHHGIDIPLPMGAPITAARAGVVKRASMTAGGYGALVELDHGGGVETRYAHCSALAVSRGERVRAGQIIAYAGSTGRSTGSHLHFEILINGVAQNPLRFVQ